MKTTIISVMLTVISLGALWAQAPENVQKAFKTAHPEANVIEWKMVGDKYKVTYTDSKNLQHNILYTEEAKVYSSENELASESFPATIKEYYLKNFPDEKGYKVWEVENEAGTKTYYSPVKDAVIFFDKDGKFIRREERTPENMEQK